MSLTFPVSPTTPSMDAEALRAALADPGFGRYYPDYMAIAQWSEQDGWHDDAITARRPFVLDPATTIFHYGQEIFEGLKAYRHEDGSVWLFRPEKNAERFARSARRMSLPVLDEADFLRAVVGFVRANLDWVPLPDGEATLYIRPYEFATERMLVVRPSRTATFAVIGTPARPYYDTTHGVALWVTRTYTRAAPGGTGAAKCGGNYAASVAAQNEAATHGCDQVLYLDGRDGTTIEEAGTMNLFVLSSDGVLRTPALGTILDGVTRDSVITLARSAGLEVREEVLRIDDLADDLADGSVTEVFASGTAATLTPISEVRGDGFTRVVGDGAPGRVTGEIREHLLDIQFGRRSDEFGWMLQVG